MHGGRSERPDGHPSLQQEEYIPSSAIGLKVIVVPVAIIITEIICLIMNYSMVSEMTRKVELEIRKAKEAEQRTGGLAAAETNSEDELQKVEDT